MSISRRSATALFASHAGAVLLGGALPAAAPAQTPAQTRDNGLVLGLSLEPTSLDPTSSPSASIGEVVHYNVFEGLTRIEENGTVAPMLAQSWSSSADGKTYTFKLLQGVRFHDDALLDAGVVRFSFERARAPQSNNKAQRSLFNNMAHIATPDAHTVVIGLQNPDSNFLFRLGENTAVILHPTSAAQASSHPIGTGPYRFEQWNKGHSITLRKFAGYRQAKQVLMEYVTFRFINSPAEQATAVLAGEIDILFNIATQNVKPFQNNNRYQIVIGSSNGKGMLALNHRRKPLNDVRVRRAITHAIDRQAFIQRMLDGRGKVIGSHFSPSEPGYVHLAGRYPYDPARARALLKEAGVQTPLKLGLALPPTPYARTDQSMLMDNLAQVGIEAQPEPMTWPQWLEGPFKGHFDMTMINHVEPLDYGIYADPDYYFGYDSPEFRALMARHSAAANPRQRQMLLAQMQRHLAEDAVNAWIFGSQITAIVRKGLKGWWMNYPIFAHDIAAIRWA